jgi:hypothetical protein
MRYAWAELDFERRVLVCQHWNSYDVGDQNMILDQITRRAIERYNVNREAPNCSRHELVYVINDENIKDWTTVQTSDSEDEDVNDDLMPLNAPAQNLSDNTIQPAIDPAIGKTR